jgi:hypothetical protein
VHDSIAAVSTSVPEPDSVAVVPSALSEKVYAEIVSVTLLPWASFSAHVWLAGDALAVEPVTVAVMLQLPDVETMPLPDVALPHVSLLVTWLVDAAWPGHVVVDVPEVGFQVPMNVVLPPVPDEPVELVHATNPPQRIADTIKLRKNIGSLQVAKTLVQAAKVIKKDVWPTRRYLAGVFCGRPAAGYGLATAWLRLAAG